MDLHTYIVKYMKTFLCYANMQQTKRMVLVGIIMMEGRGSLIGSHR